MPTDYVGHIVAVRREAAALDAALRAGALDTRTPSCPEWTTRDLAVHVGEFMGFWAHVLCEGNGQEKPAIPAPPEGPDVIDWQADNAGHLVAALEATDPQTKVWTWVSEDDTARFVARRCANELAMHRFDAQLAHDRAEPIDAALAADGIDEIFVMIPNRGGVSGGGGETLHLHATDQHEEWQLTFVDDRIDVRREHAKADAALRGPVSDLELVLYQRPPLSAVERFGNQDVLQRFYAAFSF